MLAAIPYTTFPNLPLGFNTFGLMVALGVLIGAKIGADYAERFGVDRDETYRAATFIVIAGIIGSRLTWVITHFDEVDSPLDAIAIWEGGIQFGGGFIAGLAVGLPIFLRWDRVKRWHVLDGYALGLTIGVAIGRIGCYAVGEHFGRQTGFFLGTRYDGDPPPALLDDVREPSLGPDGPLITDNGGLTFHNTSLYELIHLVVLFALMWFLIVRARKLGNEVAPATIAGLFFVWYAVLRFGTDTLRVNDERVLSMTGAQWMALAMLPYGLYLLLKVRPELAQLKAAETTSGTATATAAGLLGDDEDEDEKKPVPDKVEPPESEASSTNDENEDVEATAADTADTDADSKEPDREAAAEDKDTAESSEDEPEAGAVDEPDEAEAAADSSEAEDEDPAEDTTATKS